MFEIIKERKNNILKSGEKRFIIDTEKLQELKDNNGKSVEYNILKSSTSFDIKCNPCDYDYILNSVVKNKNRYQSNTILEFLNHRDDEVYIKYGFMDFDKTIKDNLNLKEKHLGTIKYISNKELKVSRILNYENNNLIPEIQTHLKNIIKTMNCDETIKEILTKTMTFDKVKNEMPILYYDEITEKKQWIIPNFYSDEDFIFDYETEIPLFSSNNGIINYLNKVEPSFINFKKEGFVSYSYDKIENKGIKYTDYNLPKNTFCFSNHLRFVENFTDVGDFLMSKHINENDGERKYKILLPNLSILDEEETINILKLTESKYTYEDIKKIIKKYECEKPFMNMNITFSEEKNKSINYLFVSKKMKIKNIEVDELKILNLKVDRKKESIKNDVEKVISKFYDLNLINVKTDDISLKREIKYKQLISEDKYSKLITEIKSKKDVGFLNIELGGIKAILPKNIDVFSYKPGRNETNINIELMFDLYNVGNVMYIEKEMLIVMDKLTYDNNFTNFILETDKPLILKKLDVKSFNNKETFNNIKTGIKDNLLLLHTEENELFLLDKTYKEIKKIDDTTKIKKIDNNMLKLLRLEGSSESSSLNIDLFITDNKTLYFENTSFRKRGLDIVIEKPFNFIEKNKNANDYIIEFNLPALKNEKNDYVYDIKNIENLLVSNNINDNELNIQYKSYLNNVNKLFNIYNTYENVKIKYLISSKIIDETFVNNSLLDYKKEFTIFLRLEKYIKKIEIKDIVFKNDDTIKFLKIYTEMKNKKFTFNTNENISTLQINSQDGKYICIQNQELDISLFKNIKNDVNNTLLIKDIKNKKIKKQKKLEKISLYFSDNNLYLDNGTEIKISNFNYKNTLNNEGDTILNKEDNNIFYDKDNNKLRLIIDDNKIKYIENLTQNKKNYETIKGDDLSF